MTAALEVLTGDEVIDLPDALAATAAQVDALGSGLSRDVLIAARELHQQDSPAAGRVLSEYNEVRAGDQIGLRLLAGFHSLVLTGRSPYLAAFYPTAGGRPPAQDADRHRLRDALERAMAANPDVLLASLARIPQTNETGRSLPLRGALGRVATAHGLPLRLHELAASAGLNLRADAMAWAQIPMAPAIRIVERCGCDLHPLDANNPGDRLALATYIWGDDLGRFERLRSAFVVASRIPATVKTMGAGAYVSALAHKDPVPGQVLVIWHSATWHYLDRQTRSEIRSGLRRMGGRATAASPVVHLSWEAIRDATDPGRAFALVGRSWPAAGAWAPWRAGTAVMLGTGPAHGMPVRWTEPRPLPSDPLEA